jgi:hypothetical protein
MLFTNKNETFCRKQEKDLDFTAFISIDSFSYISMSWTAQKIGILENPLFLQGISIPLSEI